MFTIVTYISTIAFSLELYVNKTRRLEQRRTIYVADHCDEFMYTGRQVKNPWNTPGFLRRVPHQYGKLSGFARVAI